MHAFFALLAFATAEPAAAPAVAPAAQQAPAPKADDQEKVCVTKAKVGTRFKDRVCYDKAEYARRQEEERKALDRLQRVPVNCKQSGGC